MIPSVLSRPFFVLANINNSTLVNIKKAKSIGLKLDGVTLPYIVTGIPSTMQILNILLPIILPSNKSCCPFLDDTIVVTSSGSDVPNAIIVKDIILSLSPKAEAISLALLTIRLLPIIMQNNPAINNIRDIIMLYLIGSSSLSLFFFAIENK